MACLLTLLLPTGVRATLYAIYGTATVSGKLTDIRKAGGPNCPTDSIATAVNTQPSTYVQTYLTSSRNRYDMTTFRFNTTDVTGTVSACTLVVVTQSKLATTRNTDAEIKFLAGTLNDPLAVADTADFGVTVTPDTTILYAGWAVAGDTTRIPLRPTWINAGGQTDIVLRPASLKDVCAATGISDYLRLKNVNSANLGDGTAPRIYITVPDVGGKHAVGQIKADDPDVWFRKTKIVRKEGQ